MPSNVGKERKSPLATFGLVLGDWISTEDSTETHARGACSNPPDSNPPDSNPPDSNPQKFAPEIHAKNLKQRTGRRNPCNAHLRDRPVWTDQLGNNHQTEKEGGDILISLFSGGLGNPIPQPSTFISTIDTACNLEGLELEI